MPALAAARAAGSAGGAGRRRRCAGSRTNRQRDVLRHLAARLRSRRVARAVRLLAHRSARPSACSCRPSTARRAPAAPPSPRWAEQEEFGTAISACTNARHERIAFVRLLRQRRRDDRPVAGRQAAQVRLGGDVVHHELLRRLPLVGECAGEQLLVDEGEAVLIGPRARAGRAAPRGRRTSASGRGARSSRRPARAWRRGRSRRP